jgi:hypothetical protein
MPRTKFEEAIEQDADIIGKMSTLDRTKAIEDIKDTCSRIVSSYQSAFGNGQVGEDGSGRVDTAASGSGEIPSGLLYGRIQSGKTRNMILTTALAIDNHFRIIIVLTSDNNDLVRQTYDAFREGLPSVVVISKAELGNIATEADLLKTMLSSTNDSPVVIVCSKGSTLLNKAIDFLRTVDAKDYPGLIFDDEGDQATLDNNVRERSGGNEAQASTIHSLIHSPDLSSLRHELPKSVFVSVTGTPQGIFLQSVGNASRPSFVKLLEPGKSYIGGDVFFPTSNPDSNQYVSVLPEDELEELLVEDADIPHGLEEAVNYFIIAASIAGMKLGWNKYKMLAHPSIRKADHNTLMVKLSDYVTSIITALTGDQQSAEYATILDALKKSYETIIQRNPALSSISFEDIIETVKTTLYQRRLFVINSTRRGETASESPSYNFLIGGNSVGRGLAIKQLLVTYYTRSPKRANMDTMHQHARMFGYRKDTLPFTQIFLPQSLYVRFHDIHESDTLMREYIKDNNGTVSAVMIPNRRRSNLVPTRSSVLDVKSIDVLVPGQQIYPDKPIYAAEAARKTRSKVIGILQSLFPNYTTTTEGRLGVDISYEDATKIVSSIKTDATNKWQDALLPTYLDTLSQQSALGDTVKLKYRTANRVNRGGLGLLPTGVLSGTELLAARAANTPTLWIVRIKGSGWDEEDFIYPTLVIPNDALPLVFNMS